MFVESLEFLVALLFVDFIGIPHPKLIILNKIMIQKQSLYTWYKGILKFAYPKTHQKLRMRLLIKQVSPYTFVYSFFLSFYNRSLGLP